jgi:hypothetical protein
MPKKTKKQEGKESYCLVPYRLIPTIQIPTAVLCFASNGLDKAPEDSVLPGLQTYGILKFSVGSFEMNFVLLTEVSVLGHCNDTLE